MATNYILRRRKLGRTSVKEICRNSNQNIKAFRNDGKQYDYTHDRYVNSGGIPLDPGFVFRWGCTSVVPGNAKIINKVEAINWASDKAQSRMEMAAEGLAPKSWLSVESFMETPQYPVIVRRRMHHQGRFLHKCDNIEQVKVACNRYGSGNYYISEYIPKVAEYRVAVISGRAAWVAKKIPSDPNAVAWNVAQGGSFVNVNWGEWPLKAVKISIQAFKLSGLDFGGVDIMVDGNGKCYVLEINSAPSQTSPYRQSCFTKCFDYIIQNGRDEIPLIEGLGDWKKFIHPAISNDALMVS